MRKLFILLSLPLLIAVLCASAWSQEITASLTGTVTDPSGAVVPDATVTIHDVATNVDVRTLTTNGSGIYDATALPEGTYTVTIKKTGFKVFIAKNVILHVGEHRAVSAQLQTGAVTQSVTVSATSTPVQLRSAAQATTITGTQVTQLMLNNRNFEQLVTLQPGVTAFADNGNSGLPAVVNFGISNTDSISVNGNRGSANNWTVDGADVNDSGSNLTLLNVPSVDAISEFTVERSNYDAQYGRSGSAQVAVVTKSGASSFHGDAYEFDRNNAFEANDFFANSTNEATPPFKYNDFGFTFGGPFYIPGHYNTDKSKTFFFWSEEWRRTSQPSTAAFTNEPTASELNGTFTGTQLNPASAPAGCITNNPVADTSQISPSCFAHNAVVYNQN
ncbi:MAG TPA: carboxypeptidase regulatory-like domain-containing protein, partial [Terriglobia bacterium]|nr:carboxypeptidase regulatory-like domain-containing protein [Terriglobia bacterium]